MELVQGNLHWEGQKKKKLTKKIFSCPNYFLGILYIFLYFLDANNNPITTYERF